MTTDDKIKDEKLQHIAKTKVTVLWALLSCESDKYLTEEKKSSEQNRKIEQPIFI